MTQRRKPRKYTDEFREEAVALVTQQGYTVTEAANSLGITSKLIYNWKDKITAKKSNDGTPLNDRSPIEFESVKEMCAA